MKKFYWIVINIPIIDVYSTVSSIMFLEITFFQVHLMKKLKKLIENVSPIASLVRLPVIIGSNGIYTIKQVFLQFY